MNRMVLKSPAEIEIMDEGNRVIRSILHDLREIIRPGLSTLDVDRFAERRILEAGGIPAFKGYPHPNGGPEFSGTVCASLNDEIVHGIPSAKVVLREGDLLSVDLGILYKGYYGDSAETFPVGRVGETAERLLRVTREALALGVEQARAGNRVSDIGHAVQSHVEASGFSVVREFVGHGIGSKLHEEPQIPNYGPPGRREVLSPGMTLAIEPMVNAGSAGTVVLDDNWTVVTADGKRSAHFEHTIAITPEGHEVLTRREPI